MSHIQISVSLSLMSHVSQSDCTLDGVPLKPEDDPEDMLDFPVLTTPWSENETQLLHQLFPSVDSLCLNFGRTGVFQWNDADSATLWGTSEWPQRIAGDLPRRLNQGGIESTKIDPRPRMPYVVFRHMGPHFDSYANSGIPEITGTAHQPFNGRGKERPDLLHLLPHLCPSDVGSNVLTRIRDLQQLATAIQESTGRRPISCFHASTMVRMYTTTPGAPQYKRIDELRKKDELWTRQHRHHRLDPSRGQIILDRCVLE